MLSVVQHKIEKGSLYEGGHATVFLRSNMRACMSIAVVRLQLDYVEKHLDRYQMWCRLEDQPIPGWSCGADRYFQATPIILLLMLTNALSVLGAYQSLDTRCGGSRLDDDAMLFDVIIELNVLMQGKTIINQNGITIKNKPKCTKEVATLSVLPNNLSPDDIEINIAPDVPQIYGLKNKTIIPNYKPVKKDGLHVKNDQRTVTESPVDKRRRRHDERRKNKKKDVKGARRKTLKKQDVKEARRKTLKKQDERRINKKIRRCCLEDQPIPGWSCGADRYFKVTPIILLLMLTNALECFAAYQSLDTRCGRSRLGFPTPKSQNNMNTYSITRWHGYHKVFLEEYGQVVPIV
ncbi:hypothetical protein TNCV_3018181 [Trichonephila clavipes]|nr:hypothetical protein TNCV_3018181 [Trichonephila clavipes]